MSSLRLGRFPVIRIPTLYILDATHVTATIATARIANDVISSPIAMLPAVQRTGVAIGDVNGTRDNVLANAELGLLVRPMIEM